MAQHDGLPSPQMTRTQMQPQQREYSAAQKPTDVLLTDLVDTFDELWARREKVSPATLTALSEYVTKMCEHMRFQFAAKLDQGERHLRRTALLAILAYERQEPTHDTSVDPLDTKAIL